MQPSPSDLLFRRALAFQHDKKPEAALQAYRDYLAQVTSDHRFFHKAHVNSVGCLSAMDQWPEAERYARRWLEVLPGDASLLHFLAQAVFAQGGRRAEAQTAIDAAVAADPEHLEARAMKIIIEGRAGRNVDRTPTRPWPRKNRYFDDPRDLVRNYVLRGYERRPLIKASTVFMTLGSCFAENLADRLRELKYKVHSEAIGEEINSTLANRYLFEWVAHGAVDRPTTLMDQVYGEAVQRRLREAVRAADVVVLTLGVAPAFFNNKTGEFGFIHTRSTMGKIYLDSHFTMRSTTVAENVENVNRVIAIVRSLARKTVKFILTVSPVPLAGTTEHSSAVIADALSKSTLRLACEDVIKAHPPRDVIYWPSFEIVRWLGAHYGPELPRVFGEHDGNSRHVSPWLVELIVELFLETFAVPQVHGPMRLPWSRPDAPVRK